MSAMVAAAIYDPQPPGSASGPIRFVTSAPSLDAVERMDRPYAVIDGDGQGIGWATHQVVDGAVQPLDGASPSPLTVLPPP